ncbi:MarR family winged helix-turn-helix transcriptional regulator [Deinococcus cellulosilyticus]|uniref:HTH marR-type domain-containing protein n=1 Tax=Deinococcus cellulosilyticus (strain DSM 18568 / NBRC 106333 / KACC 11606 / 5516J-15) TaxID=1223518 RepID=A0A511N6M6_DEIC1|nr:MarR family transcriptional regulator [Deinococcus cellulosilyticus]GEM48503.1 hypothetical protein DC3_41380 [Deinococcus cellulosilyticus NBRC 106333 = KACC 11606]
MPETAKTSLEHQTYLALVRTLQHLHQQTALLFKEKGLSGPQFNVLRILRGAGPDGATCGEIIQQLLDTSKDPDVTRLLDNLEKQGLIHRSRSQQDRRVVLSSITKKGLDLLAQLDQPLLDLHQQQFQHLGQDKLQQLYDLLQELHPGQ